MPYPIPDLTTVQLTGKYGVAGSYEDQNGNRIPADMPKGNTVTLTKYEAYHLRTRTSTAGPGSADIEDRYSFKGPFPEGKWSTWEVSGGFASRTIPHAWISLTRGGAPLVGAYFRSNTIVFLLKPFGYKTTSVAGGWRDLKIGDRIKLASTAVSERAHLPISNNEPNERNIALATYKFHYMEEKEVIPIWKSNGYHSEKESFKVVKIATK
ncbi:hypothetical protein CVT25_007168 [Psilocybe cyanescens]|uniref:Uncharacterized protein n=1 Tax=Psilocybe cyanescens TaxID=93625 RepID=A0A409WVQ7_PSICY|nr:hypothetical protein CVT25_007168 [Psilocybe cyanescens]